jgi:WD40-like Beta Propeller Repeat
MNFRVALLVLAAVLLGAGVPAGAAASEGPQLAIVVSNGYGSSVIATGPAGETPHVLLQNSDYSTLGDNLSWSSDGALFAVAASGDFPDPPRPFGRGWPVLVLGRGDGSGSRAFPRVFLNGGDPVISPDGRSVVFQRVKLVKELPDPESYLFKSAIWSFDMQSRAVKRLTRWRLAAYLEPSSFSPDGSTLLVEASGYRLKEGAMALDLRSHRLSPLALEASEPAYSSDGTRLAFVREKIRHFNLPRPDRPVGELWVARADGSGAQRLLRRKGYISSPSWDPSGARLSFTVNPPAESTGGLEPEPGNEVMAINADGTCLTKVFSDPDATAFGSAWQPGPGREAGPISC